MSGQQRWNTGPHGHQYQRPGHGQQVPGFTPDYPSQEHVSSLATAQNFSPQASIPYQSPTQTDSGYHQHQYMYQQQQYSQLQQSPVSISATNAEYRYSHPSVLSSPTAIGSSPVQARTNTWNLSGAGSASGHWQNQPNYDVRTGGYGHHYPHQVLDVHARHSSTTEGTDRIPTSYSSPMYAGPAGTEAPPQRLKPSPSSLDAAWHTSRKEGPISSTSFYGQRAPIPSHSAPSHPQMAHIAASAQPKQSSSSAFANSRPSSSAYPMPSRPPSNLGSVQQNSSLASAQTFASQPRKQFAEPRTPPQAVRSLPTALEDSPDPLSFFSPHAPTPTWQYVRPPVSRAPPPQPPSFQPASFDSLQSGQSSMISSPPKRKDEQVGTVDIKKRPKKIKLVSRSAPRNEQGIVPYDRKAFEVRAETPRTDVFGDRPKVAASNGHGHVLSEHDFTHELDDFGSQKTKTKKKKKVKKEKTSAFDLVSGIVEDSDSGMDAEGSDWDDLDVIETWNSSMARASDAVSPTLKDPSKVSTGPVKSSIRKVPLDQLQAFMEDLFEADDALPDNDTLQEMPLGSSLSHDADRFFDVVQEPSASGKGRRVIMLRAAVLQKLLKLSVKCSLPLSEVSGPAHKPQSSGQPSLSTIPVADLARVLAILERTAKVAENIDPFPSQTTRQAGSEPASPSKKRKDRSNGHLSRSPSKSPFSEDDPANVNQEQDAATHPSEKLSGPNEQSSGESGEILESLNTTLSLVDRSTLAVECCLSILSGDILPKQVVSEDLVRTCFEAIKACLDRVVLPFIEACSGAAAVASHPMLTQLIDVLAPQKARKKKAAPPVEETTQGVGVICRNTLSDLFHHLCSALFFVQRIVRMASVTLSDSIIISAVYLALGPFFVMEPEPGGGNATSENAKIAARGRSALLSLGGANAMKSLRLPALHLLRNIFAKAPDQRQWMIEEILTSLTKLTDMKKHRRQYSLRNGKAIHSINALLLQLIQGASHGVSTYVRASVDRFNRAAERGDNPELTLQQEDAHRDVVANAFNAADPNLDATQIELAIWRRGLEGANQSARSIATYLMQNVGQTKVAKASLEMSHSLIIENSIQDLLSALFLPEWPAAALMLSAFCRTFGAFLEDPKSHPDAKGVALEQLGLIATRLRQSQLTLQVVNTERSASATDLLHVDEPRSHAWDQLSVLRALRERDVSAVKDFVSHCTLISRFLARSASEDQSTEGAFEFLIVQAQGELALAHLKAEDAIEDCRANVDSSKEELAKLLVFKQELETAIATLSKLDINGLDLAWTQDEVDDKALAQATLLSENVIVTSSSMVTYEALQDLLIEGLNSQLIANRGKALRGIDKIAQIDPDILDQDSVRAAIEVRLRDSSNAVRDSAVGLFGNYVLRKPQHLPTYYKQLAARIHDTGLSVRKRMVRLLKSIHEATDDWDIRIDSCARIVRCINDEDTVVQDLAVLTIGEMWLDLEVGDLRRLRRPRSPAVEAILPESNGNGVVSHSNEADGSADEKMSDTINVIMAVAEVLKERPSPFEEVFRRIFKDRSEAEAADLHAKLQKLGDSMINGLVEASEVSTVDTVKRIRIVQLLVSTNPAILTISKAKLLLPYLKAAQTSEEVQIMDLLLRIFRSCLPHMPKTALAFAEALEKSLRPLVNRPPPKAGLHLLQELIACYCAVITLHTHNFRLLIQTLKACFVRVQSMRQMALKGQKVEDVKAWSTLMSLTASLCEHADFDTIREKHQDTTAEIDALCKRPLADVISEALLDIHQHSSEVVRSIALQNLGFIFRAYPTIMTRPAMTAMMDSIFAQGSSQDRATLLKIVLDFLNADSIRRNPDQTVVNVGGARRKQEDPNAGSVDMTILVGNTESFADTGVGAAMMQRYSEDVLKASLEVKNSSLQRTAVDILRYTVLNGLSHPIQCVPYLVSLETLEDRKLRSRALELHSHLASKHASLIQARFLDSARSAFKFQLTLSTLETLRGFRVDTVPTAMLDAWYTLLRDRRATRLDFLKQIVKAIDVNTAASDCSVVELLFARFIADNLATLDYKTMEELFTVIGELRSILAVSGMQVLYMIQGHLPTDAWLEDEADADEGDRTPPRAQFAMANLVSPMGIARNPWNTDAPEREMEPESGKSTVDAITVARMSVIAGTALLLRNHLKNLYGLSEARCAKFNPTKKQSAGADKPATVRALSDPMQVTLDLDPMPFALQPIATDADAKAQMTAYAMMVETEGTMMEPDDADMMDDFF